MTRTPIRLGKAMEKFWSLRKIKMLKPLPKKDSYFRSQFDRDRADFLLLFRFLG
jgi:hypothetical protein